MADSSDCVYTCPRCKTEFKGLSTLNNHKKANKCFWRKDFSSKIPCPFCSSTFAHHATVEKHIIRSHVSFSMKEGTEGESCQIEHAVRSNTGSAEDNLVQVMADHLLPKKLQGKKYCLGNAPTVKYVKKSSTKGEPPPSKFDEVLKRVYPCEACSYVASSYSDAKKHRFFHIRQNMDTIHEQNLTENLSQHRGGAQHSSSTKEANAAAQRNDKSADREENAADASSSTIQHMSADEEEEAAAVRTNNAAGEREMNDLLADDETYVGMFIPLKQAHKKIIQTHRYIFPDNIHFAEGAYAHIIPHLSSFIRLQLSQNEGKNLKCSIALNVEMVKIDKEGNIDEQISIPLRSSMETIRSNREVLTVIYRWLGEVDNLLENFLRLGSGWTLNDVEFLDIDTHKLPPLQGSCQFHDVTYKSGKIQFLNPPVKEKSQNRNTEEIFLGTKNEKERKDTRLTDCFYLAIARAVLGESIFDEEPDKVHRFILDKLNNYPSRKGGKAPMREQDIQPFEKAHEHLQIAINVLYQNEDGHIFPLVASTKNTNSNFQSIALLLRYYESNPDGGAEKETNESFVGHYAYVSDPSALLSRRSVSDEGKQFTRRVDICFNCFNFFYRSSTYDAHVKWCHKKGGQAIKMPPPKTFISFNPGEKNVLASYCIYFDFETYGKPCQGCKCTEEERKRADGEISMTREEQEDWALLIASGEAKKSDMPRSCPHKSRILNEQHAFAYSMVVVDRNNNVLECESYSGDDAAEMFISRLLAKEKKYLGFMQNGGVPISQEVRDQAGTPSPFDLCYLCGDQLLDDHVLDHDHLDGKFLGWAHNRCNLRRRERLVIPVMAHNFSNFDGHLIMREMTKVRKYTIIHIKVAKRPPRVHLNRSSLNSRFFSFQFTSKIKRLDAIPLNTQKFKCLYINNMVLMDSTAFLPSSLQALADTLIQSNHDFPILRQWRRLDEDNIHHLDSVEAKKDLIKQRFEASCRKGVFCYDHVKGGDDQLKKEKELPPKDAFYNQLTQEEITDEEYQFANHVFSIFQCENVLDYAKLYMEIDVLLLAECVSNMRKVLYDEFELDMCQYLSLPMMAKEIMLKVTETEMELISDYDMVLMIQRGIRGGVSFIGQRWVDLEAKKDTVWTGKHGQVKEEGYVTCDKETGDPKSIAYIDANNLYGQSMTNSMPLKDFRWMTREEIDNFNIFSDIDPKGDKGYIFEVDLEYPEELHYSHNSFPLAPEQIDITENDLSPYAQEVLRELKQNENGSRARKRKHDQSNPLPRHRARKLTSTFNTRKDYVVHGENLKYYIKKGLKLLAIKRGIVFTQSPFIKPYIELCTLKRQQAATKAISDIYKLLINSLYGKTIESNDKRMDCRFNYDENQAEKRFKCPTLKGSVICDENFSISFHRKKEVKMNQSWAVGFTVLELSKLIMQRFYYENIKKSLGHKVTMLMSDTDSFCLLVSTPDIATTMRHLHGIMDFSNYPKDHPFYDSSHKNELGKLKNEVPGTKCVTTFAGVKSKSYILRTVEDGEILSKAKGVKKSVKKELRLNDYKSVIFGKKTHEVTQYGLLAKNYVNRMVKSNKVAFSSLYDQRWLLCPIHTCPYGSILIERAKELNSCPLCLDPHMMI
jgi:hypothetical protein